MNRNPLTSAFLSTPQDKFFRFGTRKMPGCISFAFVHVRTVGRRRG